MDSVYENLVESHNGFTDSQLVHYLKWGVDGAGSLFPYNQGDMGQINSQHLLTSHLVSLHISSLTLIKRTSKSNLLERRGGVILTPQPNHQFFIKINMSDM